MPTAIIIGFEYKFNSLTGAIIDIYNAYKWCESFGCNIKIFTDIEQIKDYEILKQSINKKFTQPDILGFYNRIPHMTIVNNGQTLLTSIIKFIKYGIPDNKLIIYYSGHGVKESMVMPDKTLLPFIDFRENIMNSLTKYTEIFCILDCCNPNGLHLPFKLENNAFVLTSSKIECVCYPMLLITSSDANEKSIATKFGSLFTHSLFTALTDLNDTSHPIIIKRKSVIIPSNRNRNLNKLLSRLIASIKKVHSGYSQTVSIYSSHVIDPVLWMWIGSKKKYDIIPDMSLSFLIIRNHNDQRQTIINPYELFTY